MREYLKLMSGTCPLPSLLLLATLTAAAQFRYHNITYEQQQEQRKQAIRDAINFDYSVPDYNVSSLDENVMGWRLAKMLLLLEKNYTQWQHNRRLSMIRNKQMGATYQTFDPFDQIRVVTIQKRDSVITIKINTLVKGKKKKDDVNFDIIVTFTNSLSDDDIANSLFCDLGKYIRKDEE